MSKQLKLSASLSVLALFGVVLAGVPSHARVVRHGAMHLGLIANACSSPAISELMPLLQPGLQ